MVGASTGFIPFQRILGLGRIFGRQRNLSQKSEKMCSLQRVADLARNTIRSKVSSTEGELLRRGRALPEEVVRGEVVLTEEELRELKRAVELVGENELQVSRDDFPADDDENQANLDTIAFIPVCERPEFTMAVFVLPPGTTIPLHDHAHMYVVSRVLWGALQINSFDLTTAEGDDIRLSRFSEKGPIINAHRRPIDIVQAGEARTLTPDSGNVHSFHAQEWTAVFDVLLPPYDDSAGRSCSYYRERPAISSSHNSSAPKHVTLQVCALSSPKLSKYFLISSSNMTLSH